MAKNLSVVSIVEKNRIDSDVPFLVCLDIDVVDPVTRTTVETLHVVKNTEAITARGVTYEAANFDIDFKSEAGSQSQIQLAIKDYSKAVQARMQQYGGGVGFQVRVSVLNAGALDEDPEVVEFFEVISANAQNYLATFILGTENALAKVFPRRRQMRDFCSWRYKDGNTCKYAGSLPTCDFTLQGPNGCAAHANTINFGGFPGINRRSGMQ